MAATLEKVFIAANVREADRVAEIFNSEGIEYTESLDAVMQETSNVCYQGVLFTVSTAHADACRRLLRAHGLVSGILGRD